MTQGLAQAAHQPVGKAGGSAELSADAGVSVGRGTPRALTQPGQGSWMKGHRNVMRWWGAPRGDQSHAGLEHNPTWEAKKQS